MAGRKLQSLRDKVEDVKRHEKDYAGKLDGAETKEQRLEKQLEECRKKNSVCVEKFNIGKIDGLREREENIQYFTGKGWMQAQNTPEHELRLFEHVVTTDVKRWLSGRGMRDLQQQSCNRVSCHQEMWWMSYSSGNWSRTC